MIKKTVIDVDVRKFYDEEELEDWVYEITQERGPELVHEVEITPVPTGNANSYICFVVVIKYCKIVKSD